MITISDFTRREVTELLGVPEERIRVIPLAAGDAFGTAGAAADGDYVLAVGTLEPRKNLARLAEGARRAGLELRVVGARGWGGVQADGAGVRWLGHVPDAELAALYRGALCVAYPSLYEGFGLPVLEAMACGAPVVTSRGSATEEIAGDAAVLVDPADPASIAAGLEEAIGRREELGALGRERAAGFSWDRVAEQTVDVYREPRVSALVLMDADVLGRERTGEETYVANLLRELPALTDEFAFVAVTRHPELIPDGVEALHLRARSQELRMAWTLPGSYGACGRTRPFPARDPAPLSLSRGRHHPRPLVRARAQAARAEGPLRFPDGRAASSAQGGAADRGLGENEGRSRRAVRHSARPDHGRAPRDRSRLRAGKCARTSQPSTALKCAWHR